MRDASASAVAEIFMVMVYYLFFEHKTQWKLDSFSRSKRRQFLMMNQSVMDAPGISRTCLYSFSDSQVSVFLHCDSGTGTAFV